MTPQRMMKTLVLLVALSAVASPSLAGTIRVNPGGGGDALTIAAGIALTSDGDTLRIASGLYSEKELVVNRSIVVQGATARWPIVNGSGSGVIFNVVPGSNPKFRNLVLRNADAGIQSRREDNPQCTGPVSVWTADSLVLYNLAVGLAADNSICTASSATWSNILALNCGTAFSINDYGSVTGTRVVAANCQTGVASTHYGVVQFTCAVFWQNTVDFDGVTPITIPGLIHADPLVSILPNSAVPRIVFCVSPASPCMPANNACGAIIGIRRTGPCTAATAVDDRSVPEIRLGQNSPNPFNPRTMIPFAIASDGAVVKLDVFGVGGEHVRSLIHGFVTGGEHSASWDGRDEGGGELPSGVYFYRLQVDGRAMMRKMVLLK